MGFFGDATTTDDDAAMATMTNEMGLMTTKNDSSTKVVVYDPEAAERAIALGSKQ